MTTSYTVPAFMYQSTLRYLRLRTARSSNNQSVLTRKGESFTAHALHLSLEQLGNLKLALGDSSNDFSIE